MEKSDYQVTSRSRGLRRDEGLDTGFGEGTRGTSPAIREKQRPRFGSASAPNMHFGEGHEVHDKDAYLRPQANVYYPMGNGLGTYEDEPAPLHTLPYADTPLSPPLMPEPIRLTTPRESDVTQLPRRSSSYSSSTPIQPRVRDVEGRSIHSDAAEGAGEIGFADFLGESEVRLSRGPAERRRNSQEEVEGRIQKAFFNMLLGKVRMPTAGVGVSDVRRSGVSS